MDDLTRTEGEKSVSSVALPFGGRTRDGSDPCRVRCRTLPRQVVPLYCQVKVFFQGRIPTRSPSHPRVLVHDTRTPGSADFCGVQRGSRGGRVVRGRQVSAIRSPGRKSAQPFPIFEGVEDGKRFLSVEVVLGVGSPQGKHPRGGDKTFTLGSRVLRRP